MTSPIELQHAAAGRSRLRSRGDLTAFLTELAADAGADHYLLLAVPQGRGPGESYVLAASWVWDAVQLIGLPLIQRIAGSAWSASPGTPPRALVACRAPDTGGMLDGETARLLDVLGHGEIWCLRLGVGRRSFFLLLSGAVPGAVREEKLVSAQMECGYALSRMPGLLLAAADKDPLSDRERECLLWVSEGKTTEDVASILGVSIHTVTSYVDNALSKLGAENRSMAVATAIRSAII
ncbi:MAG: LuxR family transcriptional regulator [Mesorhizobium amorphae]|nr:MAG: LuxR family transcriptional regulator [Mesorhizobium amorphae]